MKNISDGNPAFEDVMIRLREDAGLPQVDRAAADLLGLSQSAYANRKRTGSLPFQEIVAAAAARNLSLDRIVLGRGRGRGECAEPRTPYALSAQPEPPKATEAAVVSAAESIRMVRIWGRTTAAMAAWVVAGENGIPCLALPAAWLDPGERYYANEVWTDSMTQIGINKGDVVVARATRDVPYGAIGLINVFGNGFWVREWLPRGDGSAALRARSLNPLEQEETVFTPEEVQSVFPIGIVALVIKRMGA